MANKLAGIRTWMRRKVDAETTRAGRNATRAAIDEIRKQRFLSPAAKAGVAAALLAAAGGGYALGKTAGVKRLARIERALLHQGAKAPMAMWDARRRAMEKIIRRKNRLAPVYYLANRRPT